MRSTGAVKSEILLLHIVLMMVIETFASETENSTRTYEYTNGRRHDIDFVQKISDEEKLNQIAALERIWTSVRAARLRIQKQKDAIRSFYKKVITYKGFSFEWLPEEHLSFYENKIRHLDKHLKIQNMIPKLHSSLGAFMSTLEEMLSFNKIDERTSQPSSFITRRNILAPITQDLKSTMEEVESAVDVFGLHENVSDVNEIKKVKHWEEDNPSQTHIMVQDWGVLTVYYRFIKDWEKISGMLLESYCRTVSATHQCYKSLKLADEFHT